MVITSERNQDILDVTFNIMKNVNIGQRDIISNHHRLWYKTAKEDYKMAEVAYVYV